MTITHRLKNPETGRFVRYISTKQCLICNEVFSPRVSKQKVCSVKCKTKLLPQCQSKIIEVDCKYCGIKFMPKTSYKRIYCSMDCLKEGKKLEVGEKSNGWKGGLTELRILIRSLTQYKEWRINIFERDNYTCQECKIRTKKGLGKTVTLQVDHIQSFALIMKKNKVTTIKEARNCEEFWDLDNGRTLCIECHRKTDTYGVRNFSKLKLI